MQMEKKKSKMFNQKPVGVMKNMKGRDVSRPYFFIFRNFATGS